MNASIKKTALSTIGKVLKWYCVIRMKPLQLNTITHSCPAVWEAGIMDTFSHGEKHTHIHTLTHVDTRTFSIPSLLHTHTFLDHHLSLSLMKIRDSRKLR